MPNSFSHSIRCVEQVALPYAQDSIATRFHVVVLRVIESHAFALACIRLFEFCGIAVPIVSIELDNQPNGRHKRINTELASDHMLRQVLNTKTIKDCIADTLWFGLAPSLLSSVQCDQHCMSIGIVIGALRRTIEHIAKFLKRSRFTKRLVASFACVFDLVSTLPFVCVFFAAKVVRQTKTATCDIDLFTANSAVVIFACFRFGSLPFVNTFTGTKALSRATRFDEYPAKLTFNRAHWGQIFALIFKVARVVAKSLHGGSFGAGIVFFPAIFTGFVNAIHISEQWLAFSCSVVTLRGAVFLALITILEWYGEKSCAVLADMPSQLFSVIYFVHGESSPERCNSLEISGVGSTANLDQYPCIIPHLIPTRTASEATRSHVVLSRWENHTGQTATLLERVEEVAHA